MVTSTSSVYYDPFDVEIDADPYPTFARLRDEAPVYYNERHDFWTLSRYDDVEKALVDWRTFSSARGDILEVIKANVPLPSGVVLFEDPPLHTMHRGLMSRVFTPRKMDALERDGHPGRDLRSCWAPASAVGGRSWSMRISASHLSYRSGRQPLSTTRSR